MRKPLLLLSIALLSGCSIGPDYKRPFIELPFNWGPGSDSIARQTQGRLSAAQAAQLEHWWDGFNDPVLSTLIKDGLNSNTDLLLAASRVKQARAQLDLSQADRLPELNLESGATRQKNSRESYAGRFATKPYNDFSLATVLNYEVDLWGRLARASEASRAELLASEANQDAVRLSVITEVASGYFNLRAIDAQQAVTVNTIKSRQEIYNFQRAQFRAGNITELLFRQAEAELEAARTTLPILQQARTEQVTALAVLLGHTPKALVENTIPRGKEIFDLPLPPIVITDLPSTLLQRRPDIRAAEQTLVAANAEVGVAKAAYFPVISLSALLGLDSLQTDTLLRASAHRWLLTGGLNGPLLDFGRASAGVEIVEGQKDEALINYQRAVLLAFKDVVDSIAAQRNMSERLESQAKQEKSLERYLLLSRKRYDAGYSDYLEVLDAQRSLFQAQLDTINARRDRLIQAVNLYKALGGGWRTAPAPKTNEVMAKRQY